MSGTLGIAVIAVHQRTAPLDERERIAHRAAALGSRPDTLVVSSCHRVELYATGAALTGTERLLGIDGRAHATRLEGEDAVRHLFRVAAGLDSVILGEGQIGGQLRRAHLVARERGLDPVLDRAARRAIAVARDVRGRLGLPSSRSVGSIAVDEAVRLLPRPAEATALVIGAGEMGKLSARALARRVRSVVIANRDLARAAALADGIGARAVGLASVEAELEGADAVISAADTRGTLLTQEVLERRCASRPLVVIDIAVPRSVAGDARDLVGLRYRDVDALAADRPSVARDLLERAERRCADEARAFMEDLRARAAADTIRDLRDRADAVRRRQLDRALRRLGHLPERDRRVVEGLASSLVGAIVHSPTVALRSAPDRVPAARALFGLDAQGEARK